MEKIQLTQEKKQSLLPELQQYLFDTLQHEPYTDFLVLDKLFKFNDLFDQRLQQGIEKGEIKKLSNRKDYTRRDQMSRLAEARNGLAYKLQLSDSRPKDFFVPNDKIQQGNNVDLLYYFKPDLRQKYWHDIAKHFIQDRPEFSHSHLYILNRLCDHYEDSILPLLQGSEGLHESSDRPQQETSRIVRISNPDDNNTTFGWLISQHTPKDTIVKRHRYKDDYTRIQFHPSKAEVIKELETQEDRYGKQIKRFTKILNTLPSDETQCQDLCATKIEDFNKMIHGIKFESRYGKTKVDNTIDDFKISTTNGYALWKKISSLRKKVEQQLRVAYIIMGKNKLHIKSLNKYDM